MEWLPMDQSKPGLQRPKLMNDFLLSLSHNFKSIRLFVIISVISDARPYFLWINDDLIGWSVPRIGFEGGFKSRNFSETFFINNMINPFRYFHDKSIDKILQCLRSWFILNIFLHHYLLNSSWNLLNPAAQKLPLQFLTGQLIAPAPRSSETLRKQSISRKAIPDVLWNFSPQNYRI